MSSALELTELPTLPAGLDAPRARRPTFDRDNTDKTLWEQRQDDSAKDAVFSVPNVSVGKLSIEDPSQRQLPVYPPASEIVSERVETLAETTNQRRFRMGAAFCALFLAGWNGGSTGALIPYIEKAYNITYAHVALLFVAIFLGYVLAAACAGPLSRRVGFGNAISIAVVIEIIGNVINASQQKSFGVMGFGFFVVGIAFAMQLGFCNAYFNLLPQPLKWTGVLHGIYGLGAFASPLVATAMVTRGVPYHFFYMTNVGMNVPVLALIWLAFRDLKALPELPGDLTVDVNAGSGIRQLLSNRAVWTLSIFLMLYVGAEESIGGWIVSYVLEDRHGSPENASWVASAFYLGLALGRIILPTLNVFMGERNAVFIYLVVAVVLEAIAWAVPILSSTAASTALVGVCISTFYAAAITMGGRLIPRAMHADAFSLMSSIGQSGSALFPLLVGIISTKKGIWVVEPTVVALLGAQGVMWFFVPKVARRID
ncbi:hypothetical protein PLICRDRAFT_128164 [Plicaturopsis crispa FD-325 SS-3]|nr:hypothetical protein PLICRDRAFT_128164 [Plicaturopsis crispa FD-325 SS-3]